MGETVTLLLLPRPAEAEAGRDFNVSKGFEAWKFQSVWLGNFLSGETPAPPKLRAATRESAIT